MVSTTETSDAAACGGPAVAWCPLADEALVLGVLSFVFPPLAIAAWVVGNKAINQIDASEGRLVGRPRAVTGAMCGALSALLCFVVAMEVVLRPTDFRTRYVTSTNPGDCLSCDGDPPTPPEQSAYYIYN